MDIDELSARRDGVFSGREAVSCGVSRSAITRRVKSGAWKVVARSVYLVAGHHRSARAQARIAVLSVHADAVLGGAAAAWWLGVTDVEPRKHLVFSATHGTHKRSSATAIVRHRVLASEDIVEYQGLRTTSTAITVLDASLELGITIIDTALLGRFVDVDELVAAHARYPKRHGAAKVASYLRLVGDGARSEAERITVRLLRQAGITGWTANHPVGSYIVDFAFPELRLAIEIDGFSFHHDTVTFQRDRRRGNVLVAAEWAVLHYTWADIVDRPDEVAEEVIAAINQIVAAGSR